MRESESDPSKRDKHFHRCKDLIEEAVSINDGDEQSLCSKTFYEIAKGQMQQALSFHKQCEEVIKNESKHFPYGGNQTLESLASVKALLRLAKAIIEFAKGHVREALGFLKQMVEENPRAPSDIWFGIGLCYYKLGNLPKAKLSMDKTIELDPENSMALTSLGIIEISSNINDFEVRQGAIQYFERAFQANPRNPLCISYLAEHYFMKNDHELAADLCEAGISVLASK